MQLTVETGGRPRVWTVSGLVHAIADALQVRFASVAVRGEISGFTRAASGHAYFTLKDERAQVRCALFRPKAQALRFAPRDGLQVLARGRLTLYEARGDYQLVLDHMEEAGEGALRRAFEELKAKLAAEGLILRNVQVGKIDLPPQYSERMETLLAEEMASEKMRYTLELKEKRVKESELEARADMVQRELQAEAAGKVQVIAAKAQEEAMKHVLPFKQRQVEQRKLEAEADKQSRIRTAEGNAEARRIEADGEALARQRLAQAEAFRLEAVGKANAEQMAREGSLLSRHPLLIQKVMADKLSDKVQVIIAAPGADGGFIGSGLLGHPGKAVALATASEIADGEEE